MAQPQRPDPQRGEPQRSAGPRPGSHASQPGEAAPWQGYQARRAIEESMVVAPRRATRGVRSLLKLQPSAKERAEIEQTEAMCTSFGRPISIVVANPKGAAGKTPLTLALATEFGTARGGSTLALDIHELRGTMPLRTLSGGNNATVRDFLTYLANLPRLDDVRRSDIGKFVRHQIAGQYDALVSTQRKGDELTSAEYLRLRNVLSRFYDVTVIDTANNEKAPAWEAAIAHADALVVPVKWLTDSVVPAIQMLQDLEQTNQDLVRRAVVVASHKAGEANAECRAQHKPMFDSLAAAVIELPTDPHIALGGPIIADQLSRAYRRQAHAAAAAVARTIPRSV